MTYLENQLESYIHNAIDELARTQTEADILFAMFKDYSLELDIVDEDIEHHASPTETYHYTIGWLVLHTITINSDNPVQFTWDEFVETCELTESIDHKVIELAIENFNKA